MECAQLKPSVIKHITEVTRTYGDSAKKKKNFIFVNFRISNVAKHILSVFFLVTAYIEIKVV